MPTLFKNFYYLSLLPLLLLSFSSVAKAAGQKPSALEQMFPFLLIGLVFYFLLIRPQQRKYKKLNDFISQIKVGDEVLTNSGIFGKIEGITDQFVILEIAETVRIRILKNQIASLAYQQEPTTKKDNKN